MVDVAWIKRIIIISDHDLADKKLTQLVFTIVEDGYAGKLIK